ncbi:XdhC family protein [Rhizobium tumorigenes]|uniref:XdhC family protein n=1 Tax=Rhizobium tumorigenes TaxID=2041385 RepID=A0AAF1K6E9_9HYPH|nr:XdhC family protein [Rhizobium tumorigenes]WFR96937.1 XdhC family protein [Rhizobium tumorigenes]
MSILARSDVLDTAERWAASGKALALATVTETWSSAPLPVGTQMVISADGATEGTLSNGCIESDVVAAALDVIAAGAGRLMDFRVTDEMARAAGLSCGGRIEVFVEKVG